MGCAACQMADVPESGAWTHGVTTSADSSIAELIGSGIGRTLVLSARGALDKYFVLKPVGTESAAQLRDRIAMVFTQRVASEWTGLASVDAVNASPAFTAIVADVSPQTRRKTDQELSSDRMKKMLLIGVGVLAVGLLALAVYKSKKGS